MEINIFNDNINNKEFYNNIIKIFNKIKGKDIIKIMEEEELF